MKFTGERLISASSSSWDLYLQHIGRYLFAKSLVSGKTVLDVACGSGYGSQILSQTAKRVIGVDICGETVKYCRSRYKSENLAFLQMDCCHLAFPSSSFDTVVSFETLEHLENHDRFIIELKRILKDDGLLIISTPNKEYFSLYTKGKKNPYHFKEFTRKEFEEMIGDSFILEKMLGQRFFAKKDVSLLSEFAKKKIDFGNDHFLRRIVRVGLRRLLYEKARSTHFLPWEVWANKCKVGDAAPHQSIYLIALARKNACNA
jgi:2-polyprenyl-3-methyl-5-hydroxy-6-metoxy-1,4-benzoquinol methylase